MANEILALDTPKKCLSHKNGITASFCFVLGKLCFCPYSPPSAWADDKNELALACLTPLGKGSAKEEKRSQLPFFPAKRHNDRHKKLPSNF